LGEFLGKPGRGAHIMRRSACYPSCLRRSWRSSWKRN